MFALARIIMFVFAIITLALARIIMLVLARIILLTSCLFAGQVPELACSRARRNRGAPAGS
jgi:hypothetical protein